MSLQESILQQLLENSNEQAKQLGEVSTEVRNLRTELTGASGKNGRIGTLEADVRTLRTEAGVRKGMKRAIDIAISVGSAITAFLGLNHYHAIPK